jgi:hypothetical protein
MTSLFGASTPFSVPPIVMRGCYQNSWYINRSENGPATKYSRGEITNLLSYNKDEVWSMPLSLSLITIKEIWNPWNFAGMEVR